MLFKTIVMNGDLRIFGNEAAEDERPEILNSYFVEKPEFKPFEDSQVRLSIASGLKGMGKSALLARLAYLKGKDQSHPLVVFIKGSDLVAQREFPSGNPHELIYDWQQRICNRINAELGKDIGIAINDSSISIVEQSELMGFRERNLIRSLLDRMGKKIGKLEFSRSVPKDAEKLLQRYLSCHNERDVWFIIDDIDATFRRTAEECIRLSTFFSACRMLSASVEGLKIRCAVRSDVWTSIKSIDEALDKCEQYIFNIAWNINGTRLILAHRISSFLCRDMNQQCTYNSDPTVAQQNELLRQIFPKNYSWDGLPEQPAKVIHIFSSGRPRWALQLCRLATMAAISMNKNQKPQKLTFQLIKRVTRQYGQLRIDDLIREHTHQCSQISEIIYAFARKKDKYTTEELTIVIKKSILKHFDVFIDGSTVPSTAFDVAHFLFRIGFISAKERLFSDGPVSERFYRFNERPHLLIVETNTYEGLVWVIHPVYVGPLNISN